MVGSTAGLHRDNTGWQLLDELDQCLSPHRSTDNHSAVVIYPNNAAAVLPVVDTQYGNLMARLLPFKRTTSYSMSRKGGPSQNQQIRSPQRGFNHALTPSGTINLTTSTQVGRGVLETVTLTSRKDAHTSRAWSRRSLPSGFGRRYTSKKDV